MSNENMQDTIQEQEPIENGAETPAVEDQLTTVLAELDKARQDVLYAKAEMDNVRRRAAEENDKARKFAVEKFARELLSVKDALEMAQLDNTGNVEALKMGVDLTYKALVSAFEKFELVDIAPVLGDKLDPHLHQAISMEPSEQEANTVVRVLQKGSQLSGRILRPAMVIVAAPK